MFHLYEMFVEKRKFSLNEEKIYGFIHNNWICYTLQSAIYFLFFFYLEYLSYPDSLMAEHNK